MGAVIWTGDIQVSWDALVNQPGYVLNWHMAGDLVFVDVSSFSSEEVWVEKHSCCCRQHECAPASIPSLVVWLEAFLVRLLSARVCTCQYTIAGGMVGGMSSTAIVSTSVHLPI
jgi:hypothetical protein